VLFRREEAPLREALVKSDLVECVLGLGEGLFYNSPMPATVVVLRRVKPPERRRKVLFINAVKDVAREQAQSFLRASHQRKILDAYRRFEDVDQFAAVATVDQIAVKGFSLAIPLYVAGAKASGAGDQLDVTDAVAEWRVAADAAEQALTDVLALLRAEVRL
jgi:type I restriction-modification system DNA methylase subunit